MNKDSLEFVRQLAACPELSDSEIEVTLTAAGANEFLPDGNRILAQLGLAATAFVIDSSVAFAAVSRDFTSKLKSRVNGIQHRADIAKRTGIDKHLRFDHRPGARSSGVLALATSALIGAIYRRKKCFMSVVKGLYSIGILNQHNDQCNLMEMFKDEQGDLLLMHPLAESDQAGISEAGVWGQGFPLLTDFATIPNPGVSSFRGDFECLQSEERLVQGLPLDGFTGPWSQSLSTQGPGGPIQARQELNFCHPFAQPQMQHDKFLETNFPLEEAEQCTLPPGVHDYLSLSVDACQLDGLSGQPANQNSSTRRIPCKRKDTGSAEIQKRKSPCTDDFRSSLCRETEIARALDLPSPKDTYFRPMIENRLLGLGSEVSSGLCTLLVRIGGSQSLVALRAALNYTREVRDQPHSVQSRRWAVRELAIHERFEIISQIQDNATFLQILRYNHILHLFRSTGRSVGCSSILAIESVSPGEPTGHPKTRGNPQKIKVAIAVNNMMMNIFPDLEPDSAIYKSRRRSMLGLRKLGERLHMLADCFGDAVLSLLHFDQSGPVTIEKMWVVQLRTDELYADFASILAPADDVYESFVKVLDASQGDLLREISNAADQVFEHIIYQDTRRQNLFALEMMAPEDILRWPKGSPELMNLLH